MMKVILTYISINRCVLLRGIYVSITFIIHGTESYLTHLTLKLIMTMGMHMAYLLMDMLSPFQPIGIHMEP